MQTNCDMTASFSTPVDPLARTYFRAAAAARVLFRQPPLGLTPEVRLYKKHESSLRQSCSAVRSNWWQQQRTVPEQIALLFPVFFHVRFAYFLYHVHKVYNMTDQRQTQ